MLTIKWLDADAKGYSDEIPDVWITSGKRLQKAKHYVIGPKGALHVAFCAVHSMETSIELDYIAYSEKNKSNRMDVGVLRLEFADSMKSGKPIVKWKSNDEDQFDDCSNCTRVSRSDERQNLLASLNQRFEADVLRAEKLSDSDLVERIESAPELPRQRQIKTTVFLRNPFVVAYVRRKANGRCQLCDSEAPFSSKTTGAPYLEVHHKVRLADGGKDTPDNAIALCPNCHRKKHFG